MFEIDNMSFQCYSKFINMRNNFYKSKSLISQIIRLSMSQFGLAENRIDNRPIISVCYQSGPITDQNQYCTDRLVSISDPKYSRLDRYFFSKTLAYLCLIISTTPIFGIADSKSDVEFWKNQLAYLMWP